jgi:hypothetical protein
MRRLSEVLRRREALREYVNVWPVRLPSPPGVFAAAYRHGTSELLVYVNITGQTQQVEPDLDLVGKYRVLGALGRARAAGGTVELGPYAGLWLER